MTDRIWLNGRLLPAAEAHIAANDRGFLLADGLFETMLARDGRIVSLERHMMRLAEGASVMGLPMPHTPGVLAAACRETLAANGLREAPRASLRLTLTRGPGPRGIAPPKEPSPTVLITAAEAPPAPAAMRVATSTVRRIATSPASRLKTLAYTDSVLARAEAPEADEVLLLTEDDGIACASAANVFVVKDGSVTTPPADGAILPGLTRADVLMLAADLGIEAREAPLPRTALAGTDEVFLTNSLIGVCPVTALDSRSLAAGPVTKKLAQALDEAWASNP